MSNPTMWFEVPGKDQRGAEGLLHRALRLEAERHPTPQMPYDDREAEASGIPGGIGRRADGIGATSPSTSRSTTSRRRWLEGRVARRQAGHGPDGHPRRPDRPFADPEGHVIGLATSDAEAA